MPSKIFHRKAGAAVKAIPALRKALRARGIKARDYSEAYRKRLLEYERAALRAEMPEDIEKEDRDAYQKRLSLLGVARMRGKATGWAAAKFEVKSKVIGKTATGLPRLEKHYYQFSTTKQKDGTWFRDSDIPVRELTVKQLRGQQGRYQYHQSVRALAGVLGTTYHEAQGILTDAKDEHQTKDWREAYKWLTGERSPKGGRKR